MLIPNSILARGQADAAVCPRAKVAFSSDSQRWCRMKNRVALLLFVPAAILFMAAVSQFPIDKDRAEDNAERLINEGRHVFRFDTFGDEAFWTDQLHIQQAVSGLSPQTALALGLKVDADALPASVLSAIKLGQVNLTDPSVTLSLIKLNAVVGVHGRFNGNTLTRVGFTCALC